MAKICQHHFTKLRQVGFVSLYRALRGLIIKVILMLSFVVKSLTVRYVKDLLIFTNSTFGQDTYYMVCYYYFNETEHSQFHSYKVNNMGNKVTAVNLLLLTNAVFADYTQGETHNTVVEMTSNTGYIEIVKHLANNEIELAVTKIVEYCFLELIEPFADSDEFGELHNIANALFDLIEGK
ncbi:hypothetical protein [Vibrio phage vB_VibM_83AMN]|nr:hypothetical protein [Vibrio phage vB_VibM_83AMN]